jgi:hypothetical protein
MTRLPDPLDATATKRPLPYVTARQLLSAALVWLVQVMPSGLVMTRLPDPEDATATKRPLPYVTARQLLSAALVWLVQVMPSGLVMTRLPDPEVATITWTLDQTPTSGEESSSSGIELELIL